MKVLVVTNMWPEEANPARGIFVAEQVESLRTRGIEVEVLHLDTRPSRLRYASFLPRLLRAAARFRPALVHAHYGLVGAALAPWRLTPLVVTFHGSDVHIGWQRRVSRVAALAARERIFVSTSLREALGVKGVVIPCGVDLDHFSPRPRAEARARFGLDDRPVLLFPAAPENPAKGWPLLQEAIARLEHPPQVIALKGYSRQEVPWLLSAVDLLVITSRYEGGPIVLKEALACGLPVVSVRVGDAVERLQGLPGSAVVRRDPGALATAIHAAITPPSRVNARRVCTVFGHPAVAQELDALYARVAGR